MNLLSGQIQFHPQASAQIRQSLVWIIRLNSPEANLVPVGLGVHRQVVLVDCEVEARDRVLDYCAEAQNGDHRDNDDYFHDKTCCDEIRF